ncbi:MAG: hypothetical protein NT074_02285 [Methanomicrobiales archaeon]|nr:hypothetical protein [Methanomicrobiales archaeon]
MRLIPHQRLAGVALLVIVVLLVIMPAAVTGAGKLAVPGLADSVCFGGSGNELLPSFELTTDRGLIFSGSTNSHDGDVGGNYGGMDIWVAKLDMFRSIEWSQYYGGSNDEWCYDIHKTSDGGYILTGSTDSNTDDVQGYHGGTGSDIWVVKLNQTGGIQWQGCYGGSDDDAGYAIEQVRDGGYIVAGYTKSNTSDVVGHHGPAGTSDLWVVKLNSTGSLQWQKCLGGTLDDEGYSIYQTDEGGYIITGSVLSIDGDVSGNHGLMDAWVVKLSEDGMVQWQKCLGGSSYDNGYIIRRTIEGGSILIGDTMSNNGDVSGNRGNRDVWVVKLNSTGSLLWQRCLGGSMTDEGKDIHQTTDGGYILTGYSVSNDWDVSGSHGNGDIWVVRMSSEGWPLWQKCLGGFDQDSVGKILQGNDGEFTLLAYTASNDGDVAGSGKHLLSDFWLVNLYGPPILNGIAPVRATAGTNPTIVLTGENLVQNPSGGWGTPPTVTLTKDGTPEIPLIITGFGPNRLEGQPGLGTLVVPGVYSVRVMTLDSQYTILPNAFTVTCGLAPTITSITLITGTQGGFYNPVTIKGTRFWNIWGPSTGVSVYLNRTGQSNIPMSVDFNNATHITANFLIPAGTLPGAWNLVVRNPDGQLVVKASAFTVKARTAPTISAVSRTSGYQNTTVPFTLIGSQYQDASTVIFNRTGGSIPATVSSVTETRITGSVNIPANAPTGSWNIAVTTSDGRIGVKTNAFTVTKWPRPVTSSVTPPSGYSNTTVAFTLTGTNYQTGSVVNFTNSTYGTVTITISSIMSTKITGNATFPVVASSGKWNINVTTPDGGTGTKAGAFTVNSWPKPMISSITPTTGTNATTVSFTLNGNYFQGGSIVNFTNTTAGNLTASVTSTTLTQIRGTVWIPGGRKGAYGLEV